MMNKILLNLRKLFSPSPGKARSNIVDSRKKLASCRTFQDFMNSHQKSYRKVIQKLFFKNNLFILFHRPWYAFEFFYVLFVRVLRVSARGDEWKCFSTLLQCAFLYVFSKNLGQSMQNHTDCICYIFLQCSYSKFPQIDCPRKGSHIVMHCTIG